jgi:hypothetical protein
LAAKAAPFAVVALVTSEFVTFVAFCAGGLLAVGLGLMTAHGD